MRARGGGGLRDLIRKSWWRPLATAAVVVLAACGGGGGGGGGGAVNFNTTEFQANFGLASIGALTAFNNSGSGTGITVAIIDTGIDVNNAEFTGAIAAASTDTVTNNSTFLQDISGHGTAVADVIGARKNGSLTHGVAFSSTLLALRTDTIGSCFTSCSFTNTNIATAIDFAVANGANVINISLGGGASSAVLETALTAASNAGVITVISAGNSAGANPLNPALFASTGTTLGIAVGSTNSANAFSSFSNRAGTAQNKYLVAPGQAIVTTNLGGGTTTVDGTSFSAPHVAGAAAVLLQLFPTLTSAQVVDLMFTSATDLGTAGTDTTFGRGLINLQAALQAQGIVSMPTGATVSGGSEALRSTVLSFGPAFGDALESERFLESAMVLDAYQRPYDADLRDRIAAAGARPAVLGFVTPPALRTVSTPSIGGVSLALRLASTEDETVPGGWPSARSDGLSAAALQSEPAPPAAHLRARLGAQREINAVIGASTFDLFQQGEVWPAASTLFIDSQTAAAPQLTLLGPGDGASLQATFCARNKFVAGVMSSEGEPGPGGGSGTLVQAEFTHMTRNGIRIGLGAGQVNEDAALYRTAASGAFSDLAAASSFVTIAARAPLSDDIALHASYTDANTAVSDAGGGFITNWGRIRASAATLGITAREVFRPGDRLGFLASQPMRVYRARADLTLPVARTLDGAILKETRRVSLSPSGRQRDLQIAYEWRAAAGLTAASFALATIEPGHRRGAAPSFAAGLRLRLDF